MSFQTMSFQTRSLVLLSTLALCTCSARAEDESPTYVDPQQAGPDYAVQGEYLGTLDVDTPGTKWGAQVIALGNGTFRLVGYEGGLPGQPWQRGDRQEVAEGATKGKVTRFESADWEAEIKGDTLSVYTRNGEALGTLKKTSRKSPTLGATPPAGALVLFDGKSADHFEGGSMTDDGLLKSNCQSKEDFGDHSLHIEFRTPFKPMARGQQRGNSGVYVQSRYEVQVLDSFGLEGKNNECGGIYSITEPRVNMCYPPLTWQTYDIDFTAARYDGDKKVKNAKITVRHNGIVIIDDIELPHGTPGRLKEGPTDAPLFLQGHGNPVVYRNIWAVKKSK